MRDRKRESLDIFLCQIFVAELNALLVIATARGINFAQMAGERFSI